MASIDELIEDTLYPKALSTVSGKTGQASPLQAARKLQDPLP